MAKWAYVVVWEFRVRAGMEKAFESVYGPTGDWAQLFSKGEGYVATELNRDLKDTRRYLTLDFWESEEAYGRFRASYGDQYKAIDAKCEELTESEAEVGAFARL